MPRTNPWKHPCANCGAPCGNDAVHCRACMYLLRTWVKPFREAEPPTEQTDTRPNELFELYCLLCGRGVGVRGELVVTPQPPTRRPDPCRTCGGTLFVREVTASDLSHVVLPNPTRSESHVRRVA